MSSAKRANFTKELQPLTDYHIVPYEAEVKQCIADLFPPEAVEVLKKLQTDTKQFNMGKMLLQRYGETGVINLLCSVRDIIKIDKSVLCDSHLDEMISDSLQDLVNELSYQRPPSNETASSH